jgi:hypothetical protein
MVYNHQHTSASNTSSVELFYIATDDMSLSNELQKTAKEFEFGSLHNDLNLFEKSGVRTPNLDMLLSPYPFSQHQQTKVYFL